MPGCSTRPVGETALASPPVEKQESLGDAILDGFGGTVPIAIGSMMVQAAEVLGGTLALVGSDAPVVTANCPAIVGEIRRIELQGSRRMIHAQ